MTKMIPSSLDYYNKKVIGRIMDKYDMYHQERLENAYADIDALISTGKHA